MLGERIDTRTFDTADRLAAAPLTLRVTGEGIVVVQRYGAVILFGVSPLEEASVLQHLEAHIVQRYERPAMESIELQFDATQADERISGNILHLQDKSLPRLQVVADILGKSVALDHYESTIAKAFDLVEPVAAGLEHKGRWGKEGRKLLMLLGSALRSEQRMTGRVEVGEKPDVLWDHPELQRLYLRLEDEFEIRERSQAIERKLNLITRTAHTVLDLEANSRTLRVEWYIVILIVIEILLTLYDFFIK
jgi:uncharacterized Rmd1/YagE family protein